MTCGKVKHSLIAALSFLALPGAFAAEPSSASAKAPAQRISIEASYLKDVPKTFPADGGSWFSKGVKAIYYEGPEYKGKPTKVFAYYGLPADMKKGEKVPGIVLIHGGGGTAYAEWVRLWNSRGYAAISMDLCGSVPVKSPDGNGWIKMPSSGGPAGWESSFSQLGEPIRDQWPCYAVNAIARARTFLGAQAEIDSSRIGLTGVSWGGYLTCLVAGLDSRYAFAVPVYGCGFLRDGGSAWSVGLKRPGMESWTLQFDPAMYLPDAKMPMLWVTGTNDFAYPMEALKMSYSLVKAPVSLSVTVRMPHGHSGPGESPAEILAFANSFCKGEPALMAVVQQGRDGNRAWAACNAPAALESAELVFTKDGGANKERKWETLKAEVDMASNRVSAALPAGVKLYYFNLHDKRNLTVSSPHEEMK